MRWRSCHICGAEDETIRDDKTMVHIFECHCCWNEYCDKHGYKDTRICDICLDKSYKMKEKMTKRSL
jgi:hypothetical protein